LSSPVKLRYNCLLLLLPVFLFGCLNEFVSNNNGSQQNTSKRFLLSDGGVFALSQQKIPEKHIKSILLHHSESVFAPPIIELGSGQQLILEFDALINQSEQYRIEFSHHNQHWDRSNLLVNDYIDGFEQTFITGGERSRPRNPLYFHYSYTFPNEQVNFTKSGNYMIQVFDNVTGQKLFNLPFFVHENEGKINSFVETIFNMGRNGRPLDQPFSTYTYPDFVEFPQFDLTFTFSQNQLWGTTKTSKTFDTSVPGEVRFHLSRDRAYPSDFEFNILDLSKLQIDGDQILDVQPRFDPPKIFLNQDIQNFASNPTPLSPTRFGIPDNRLSSRFADVYFSFEPRNILKNNAKVYLLGDFNQWQIDQSLQMSFDSVSGYWETNTLIKQGKYSYKYLLVEDNTARPLYLDDGYTRSKQQYISFVYFKDPAQRFDRLLQVDIFYSD